MPPSDIVHTSAELKITYKELLSAKEKINKLSEDAISSLVNHGVQFVFLIDAIGAPQEKLAVTLDSFSCLNYENLHFIALSELARYGNNDPKLEWIQCDEYRGDFLLNLAYRQPNDWFCIIKAGDQISQTGLPTLALLLREKPDVGLVYADDDVEVQPDEITHFFRPDFDLDYLRSYPYIGNCILVRGREYCSIGGFDHTFGSAQFYDFIFRFYEQYQKASVFHFAKILFRKQPINYEEGALGSHRNALEAHLRRSSIPSEVTTGLLPDSFRVRYIHENQPFVSIIIPTRNQLPVLRRCLETLLETTDYKNYEILIVDNQSTDVDAADYLRRLADMDLPNLQVLSYPYSFNFADMNNLAAQEARGEYLVLLNNDTAIIKPDWLDALLNHAQRPDVGIVGAKLLSPDGKIQHGGVILGLHGPADHAFIGKAMDAPGYCGRLLLDQQYSAVTAACLMVRKSVYESVGGMDTEAFKVSYNNVDLCLKVREAGYRIIWTPHALVMHEGSVSQSLTDAETKEAKLNRLLEEQQLMYQKWLPSLISDPAYNPNLSLKGEGFELEIDPLFTPYSRQSSPRVLAHTGDHLACGQYRVIQPLSALVTSNLANGVCQDLYLDPIHVAKLAPDIIVVQRQFTDQQISAIQRYRQFSSAKIISDLDDYLINLPMLNAHKQHMPKNILRKMRESASLCDSVVVSTEPLKAALADLHVDIKVIPNYLPMNWWGKMAPREAFNGRSKPRVGWAGGISHRGDLRLITDVVKILADRVDWVFFGMQPEGLESFVTEYHPGVEINAYPAKLASLNLDLALAPLENNLFNECKSNLRLMEFGICGYPVIATDIEPFRCGLPVTLVKNRFKDWLTAIEDKLADRDALLAEGNALQAAVRNNWMLEGSNLMRWRDGWMLGNVEDGKNR